MLGALVLDHHQHQPIVHLSVRSQNWAGMRCPYKLLRMVLALVCSEYLAMPSTPGGAHFFGE